MKAEDLVKSYVTAQPPLFTHFVTICLSPHIWGDRRSPRGIAEKVSLYANFLNCQGCNFRYLLVPELHPTSGAYHLHGAVSGLPPQELCAFDPRGKWPPYIRKQLNKGEAIYRSPTLERLFGYNVIKAIGNRQQQLADYITKKMTVCEDPPYGFSYLVSEGLNHGK